MKQINAHFKYLHIRTTPLNEKHDQFFNNFHCVNYFETQFYLIRKKNEKQNDEDSIILSMFVLLTTNILIKFYLFFFVYL